MSSLTAEKLGKILAEFSKKNVRLQSMAGAKHEFQNLAFKGVNQKVFDEVQRQARKAFGIAVKAIIEQVILVKKALHLTQ